MTVSWYKRYLPTILDAKQALSGLVSNLKRIEGVKDILVFGSFVDHFNQPNVRIKDVDILIRVPFHSEDLIAINKKVFAMSEGSLENEGFDPGAVRFSKKLASIENVVPIDAWALSSDKKLLHWGPMISTREESDEIKKEAEEYAAKQTGFNLKKIQKAGPRSRKNWYSTYHRYVQSQLGDMPFGWYCSEEEDISPILNQSVKIS